MGDGPWGWTMGYGPWGWTMGMDHGGWTMGNGPWGWTMGDGPWGVTMGMASPVAELGFVAGGVDDKFKGPAKTSRGRQIDKFVS